MREFEVKSTMNLYKLHEFIQNELSFAPDQVVCFEAFNAEGKMKNEYGLFDFGAGTMDTVTIDDVIAKEEYVLRYVFDFQNYRYINLQLIKKSETVERVSYPRTVAEKGHNPDQFSTVYEELVEQEPENLED